MQKGYYNQAEANQQISFATIIDQEQIGDFNKALGIHNGRLFDADDNPVPGNKIVQYQEGFGNSVISNISEGISSEQSQIGLENTSSVFSFTLTGSIINQQQEGTRNTANANSFVNFGGSFINQLQKGVENSANIKISSFDFGNATQEQIGENNIADANILDSGLKQFQDRRSNILTFDGDATFAEQIQMGDRNQASIIALGVIEVNGEIVSGINVEQIQEGQENITMADLNNSVTFSHINVQQTQNGQKNIVIADIKLPRGANFIQHNFKQNQEGFKNMAGMNASPDQIENGKIEIKQIQSGDENTITTTITGIGDAEGIQHGNFNQIEQTLNTGGLVMANQYGSENTVTQVQNGIGNESIASQGTTIELASLNTNLIRK